MKRILITCALASLLAFTAAAQGKWNLAACVEQARKQNLDVQRRINDSRTADVQKNTATNSRLPGVSANVNQNFQFGYTVGANNTYSNQNSAATTFGANASVNVFQGGYINNRIKYSDWSLQAAVEDINQTAEDISIKVTLAYLQVLYNKEIVVVAEGNLEQSKSQVKKTEDLVTNGRLAKSDLYDAKAQMAKDEYALTKAQGDLKLSLLDLAQLIELTNVESFDIEVPNTDKVAVNSDAVIALSEGNIEGAYGRRPAVKAAEYRLQAGEQYIKMMKSAYYPTVSFVASYGNSYYNPFGVSNTASFATQLKNQSQEILGIQVNIPIFSRFESRNNVTMAKIDLDQRKVNLTDAKKTLFKEIQQAYYNAMTAQRNFVSSQKSLEASTLSFSYIQEKFDAGKSTIFEINEAKKRLTTSQSELAQARYEYIFRTKLLDYYNGIPITL